MHIHFKHIYSFQRVIYYAGLADVAGVVQQWLSEEEKGEKLMIVKLMRLDISEVPTWSWRNLQELLLFSLCYTGFLRKLASIQATVTREIYMPE